jgi:excisionase family DNA binding protein
MAHPTYLREKARALRAERRLTIDELAERLALSRSTIYHWVRDLPIPGSGSGGEWPEAARRKGTRAMQRKYRLLREQAYQEGLRSYAELVGEPGFRDFVCLYVAEGYKRTRHQVSVCNSDPAVVRLCDHWIRRFAGRPIEYSIAFHVDQDLEWLRAFWARELTIDGPTIKLHRKSNSNHLTGRVWRSQYGVLTVKSNDTYFRAKLEAWIDILKQEWGRVWG